MQLNTTRDANAEDYGEWTALMSACFRGHEVGVSQLIEAGVNVDAKGEDGNTSIDAGLLWLRWDCIKLLKEAMMPVIRGMDSIDAG